MAVVMSTIALTKTAAATTLLSTKSVPPSSIVAASSSSSSSSTFSISALPSRSSLRIASLAEASASVVVSVRKNSIPDLCLGFSGSAFGGSGLRFCVPSKLNCGSKVVLAGGGVKVLAIAVGEQLPEADLAFLDEEEIVQTVKVSELSRGKKLVLFAVPGAFTPTCSQKHLPGFVEKAQELRDAGVDTIACVSVNDVFVMKAWGESVGVGDKVLLLADGLGKFTKALGATLDLNDKPSGLGVRSRRYALLAEDGVVKSLNMEDGGAFTISGPVEILEALKAVV